jgi:hypothetical protein
MPPAKPPSGSAAAVSSTLDELFNKHLPSLWAQSTTGAPKFFQSGIELISVSVKAGPVDVSLTVAGKDAKTLQFPTLPGEASQAVVGRDGG